MSEKFSTEPTDAELRILQILWQHGPSSVRTVNQFVNKDKEVGYTTTLKFMQIMCEKGLLDRRSEGRKHIYFVKRTEEETQRMMLNKFVEKAFRGSAMKLVMQALGNEKTSPEELQTIKEHIAQLEKQEEE